MVASRRPDLLFLVVDCARAADLVVQSDFVQSLPTWSRLSRRSIVFKNAVSPSSWTLPAHASMLTGMYPWDHRLLMGVGTKLAPGVPTVSRKLAEIGYETACFSANPLICTESGLTSGFATKMWGRFVDCYLRSVSRAFTQPMSSNAADLPSVLRAFEREAGLALRSAMKKAVLTFPAAFDAAVRGGARLAGGPIPWPADVAPWIEPEFERWLGKVTPSSPCFAFINLLDAHEPYIGLPEHPSSLSEWFSLMKVRQDSLQLFFGGRKPKAVDLAVLHRLYRDSLRVADRRVGQILDIFSKLRDPENAVIVLTSDHGQAFGEHGQIYHGRGATDEIVRVPLLVSYPKSSALTGEDRNWVSTASIFSDHVLPAIDSTASSPHYLNPAANRSGAEHGPVFSISEHSSEPTETKSTLEAPIRTGSLVGYLEALKLELDIRSGHVRAYEPDGPSPTEIAYDPQDSNAASLVARLRALAGTLCRSSSSGEQTAMMRLQGWGY